VTVTARGVVSFKSETQVAAPDRTTDDLHVVGEVPLIDGRIARALLVVLRSVENPAP
jgi:hypothetical protein